ISPLTCEKEKISSEYFFKQKTNQNQPPIIVIPPQQPAPLSKNYQPLPPQSPQAFPIVELPTSEKQEPPRLSDLKTSKAELLPPIGENMRTTSCEKSKRRTSNKGEK
ncbi:7698_t:CDS:1, partial [Racocetra persica]